jgi:hypothetical protein
MHKFSMRVLASFDALRSLMTIWVILAFICSNLPSVYRCMCKHMSSVLMSNCSCVLSYDEGMDTYGIA